MSITTQHTSMTRTDKILHIAQTLEPGVISGTVKRLLLKAEYILDVAYATEEDATELASYHAKTNSDTEPKEVPIHPELQKVIVSKRQATIRAKKDWATRRVATKPKQDRQDLISLLKSYGMRYGFNVKDIVTQAKRQGFDIRIEDISNWFGGANLPSDYKFDQIMKFLEVNDKGKDEEKKES